MVDFTVLPAFILATFAICIAPGPDQAFILASASTGGKRAGLLASVGMAVGIAVHTTLTALGLAVLLGSSPVALDVVRVAGAAYLAYLAFSTFRSLRHSDDPDAVDDEPVDGGQAFRRGVLVNLTNPKIILFFASFFPQFAGGADSLRLQFLLLGLAFLVVGLVIDCAIGLAAGQLSDSSSSSRVRTGLTVLAGTTYLVLAAVLVYEVF